MNRGGMSVTFEMFLLMALLIAVAYFVGLVSDVNQVGNTSIGLIKALTGQGASGFQNYPGGASKPAVIPQAA